MGPCSQIRSRDQSLSLSFVCCKHHKPLPIPSMYILGSSKTLLPPQSPLFRETNVTILITFHKNINIFASKVVPYEVYTCPALSNYQKHPCNSIFTILNITRHSTLIPVIFIYGDRKKSRGARLCKEVVLNPHQAFSG